MRRSSQQFGLLVTAWLAAMLAVPLVGLGVLVEIEGETVFQDMSAALFWILAVLLAIYSVLAHIYANRQVIPQYFLDSIVKSLAQIRDQGNVVNKPNKTPNDPPLVRR